MAKQTDSVFDQMRMLECLSLAERGAGYVSPNPMVGAIVVKNGRIVGRGYHKRFGSPHAEIFALRQAGSQARRATLYMNLEPCCYHGKTPPCTDAIIRAGISRVVVGMRDPNPRVDGKGVRRLRKAGIRVTVGVLEKECRKLNEAFVKYAMTGLPFVTLKIAQTLDGKIADERGHSRWITGDRARKLVHALRGRHDAVVVGANTVKQDNPRLTVRLVRGRNPYRVVIDGNLSSPLSANVFRDQDRSRTFLVVGSHGAGKKRARELEKRGVKVLTLQGAKGGIIPIDTILRELGQRNIASVMVEGGQRIFTEFFESGVVDKVIVFVGARVLGGGLSVFDFTNKRRLKNALEVTEVSSWNLGGDLMVEGYLRKKRKKV